MKLTAIFLTLCVIALLLYNSANLSAQDNSPPSLNRTPDWSPDGKHILFTSYQVNNLEIFSIESSGSNPINLTQSPSDDDFASWSPDGSFIAFLSDRSGRIFDLWIMASDGANPTNLTGEADMEGVIAYAWSPDSQYLAFLGSLDAQNAGLWVVNLSTHELIKLSEADFVGQIIWSPDSQRIAAFIFADYRITKLVLVSLEEKDTIDLLSTGDYVISELEWSSQNNIILAVVRSSTDNTDITLIDPDSGEAVFLESPFGRISDDPAFSPDGTKIAFYVSSGSTDTITFDESHIWIMQADGSEPQNLTASIAGSHLNPKWSPDGTQIVFTVIDDQNNFQIWLVDSDGSKASNLTGGLIQ